MQKIWEYKKLNRIGKWWTAIINTLTAGQKVMDHSLNCVLVNSQMWTICFLSEHISCWLVWRLAINLAVYTNMQCILSRGCVLLWAWIYGSRQLHLCSMCVPAAVTAAEWCNISLYQAEVSIDLVGYDVFISFRSASLTSKLYQNWAQYLQLEWVNQ